jgi:hypothetical protein
MQRFKRLRVRWPLMGSNPPNVRLANCLGRRWFRKLGGRDKMPDSSQGVRPYEKQNKPAK